MKFCILLVSWARGSRAGAALLEVIISIVLTAIAVAAIMSVMVTTSVQAPKSEYREQGSLALNQVLHELRNYVTDDHTGADGPNNGSWQLPGDDCPGWALDDTCQTHNVTRSADWPAVTVHYSVTTQQVRGLETRQVNGTAEWTVPTP